MTHKTEPRPSAEGRGSEGDHVGALIDPRDKPADEDFQAACGEIASGAKQPKPKCWREVIPIHPCADLFPLMQRAELRALADDMKQNGQHMPVALFDDPQLGRCVLDGRNRFDAHELNGGDYGDVDYEVVEGDPLAYVLSINFRRRHLTTKQKRVLVAKLLTLYPTKSNNAFAGMTGISDKTFASERRRLESRSEIPNVDQREDTKGRLQPATKPKVAVAALKKENEALAAHVEEMEAAREEEPRRQTRIEKLTAENDALRKRVQELEYRLSQNGDRCDFRLSTADEIALTIAQQMSRTKFQDVSKRALDYFKVKDTGKKPRKQQSGKLDTEETRP